MACLSFELIKRVLGLCPCKHSAAVLRALLQEGRLRPDTGDIAPQRGRADLDEPRRSREAPDDRRRPREDDRSRVKKKAAPTIPEAMPEPLVSSTSTSCVASL